MKRALTVLLVIFLLLVSALLVTPFFLKDKVIDYVKNESVNARLEFDEDIELSVFKRFPELFLAINDIKVINKAPFEGDTLLALDRLEIELDLMEILGGNYVVEKIRVVQPDVHVIVLPDGAANYDIALPEENAPETESDSTAPYEFYLTELLVENANISYSDATLATDVAVSGLNFSMSGKFDEEKMSLQLLTLAEAIDLDFEGVRYLSGAKADYKADMLLYLEEERYVFNDNELLLNALSLTMDGEMGFVGDDMNFDLRYGLNKSEFKQLLSLIPAVYSQDFEGVKADGQLALNGELKGLLTETTYPAFSLNLAVENGNFAYPGMPSKINNLQLDLGIANPDGIIDNTVLNLDNLHLEIDQEPFDFSLKLSHPESDPNVAASAKGMINLNRVKQLIPLEGLDQLAGIVKADASVKGQLSSIEEERYEDFYAAGAVELREFQYESADLPENIGIPSARFTINPAQATLENFDLRLGESDLSMKGQIENYLAWFLKSDTLRGSLDLASNYLNVNPWLEEEDANTTDGESDTGSYELELIEIPENLDLRLSSNMQQLVFEDFDLKKFNGILIVKNGSLKFNEVSVNTLGGSMLLNGFYSCTQPEQARYAMSFRMAGVSIPGVYNQFMTIQRLIPMAKQMDGDLDGRMNFGGDLNSDFTPKLATVDGGAKLSIDKVSLSGNAVWNKAVDYLKAGDGAKKLILTRIRPSFNIEKGNLKLDTFDFKTLGQSFRFGGVSNLNTEIDFALDTEIPAESLKKGAESLLAKTIGGVDQLNLASTVPLRFGITGTLKDPKIKPELKGQANFKSKAKEELKKKAGELKEEGIKKTKAELRKQAAALKAQADQLRAKADALEKEATDLRKKAEAIKAEGDKLQKEAEAQKVKIEKEMANLPEFAREKAMKPVNALFDKANTKFDQSQEFLNKANIPEKKARELRQKANRLEQQADELLADE